MPRGPVIFSLPPGTTPQQPNDVIQSAVWNAAMDDIAQTFNTPQPIAYGGTGATSKATAVTALGVVSYDTQSLSNTEQRQARTNLGATILGDIRNLIRNPLGMINQRNYVSSTPTGGANNYTIDGWRVVVSGQALSYTDSVGVRNMAPPAGGLEQVVPGEVIQSGPYVLSWGGTSTATVDGVARAKGDVFVLTGGTSCVIRFTGGSLNCPQLERGSSITDFTYRHYQQELAICQRYAQPFEFQLQLQAGGVSAVLQVKVPLAVPMRTSPSTALANAGTTVNVSDIQIFANSSFVTMQMTSTASGTTGVANRSYFFTAEPT